MRVAQPTRPLRVLLVDLDPRVRAALRELITAEPDLHVCGDAADAKQAIDRIGTNQPDVVLLDLMLPRAPDGFDVVGILCTQRLPFVVLTTATRLRDQAIRLGASAFLEKDDHSDLITEALRAAGAHP
jgi:DNA-binding NarL/FixJ family response regulator